MQFSGHKLKPFKLEAIFISHLHGDHFFGLFGLLNSMSLMNRKKSLRIYAHEGLRAILEVQFKHMKAEPVSLETAMTYPIEFFSLPDSGSIYEDDNVTVSCFPLDHRILCNGFVFEEKQQRKKLNVAQLSAQEIPREKWNSIQNGEDYLQIDGKSIPNTELTLPGPKNRKYAYLSDTKYNEDFFPFIAEVDLAYIESTYLKNEAQKAEERFHCTTQHAALIAKNCKIGKLLLGHYSSQYRDIDNFETEAREVFANSEASVQGQFYDVERID